MTRITLSNMTTSHARRTPLRQLAAQLTDDWNAGQRNRVSLSSHGELVEVFDTGHYIHIDQAALVVEQITSLLA